VKDELIISQGHRSRSSSYRVNISKKLTGMSDERQNRLILSV